MTSAGFYTKKDLHKDLYKQKVVCCFNKSWEVSTCIVKANLEQRRQKRQLRLYLPRLRGLMGQADGKHTSRHMDA